MTRRHVIVRAPGGSLRLELRALGALGALMALAAAGLAVSLARGAFGVPLADVLAALAGAGDETTRFVVVDLRLPRALAALLAGCALGIAGAIFQDVARNPLVAPDLIGVSGGASLAAVSLIVFGDATGPVSVPLAALAGALVTGALLYLLAWRGGVQGYRLVLVGIGVAAMLQAGVSYVLTRGGLLDVQQAYVWMVGSLNGRGWEHVWPLAAALAVVAPALPAIARRLAALQLGDDLARALGVGVERARLVALGAAVALTGVAIAATGPIAFVAFVAPHVARRLGRTASPGPVLAVAGAVGAVLVTGADLAGRELVAPTEIPVGIVTAILAAHYFLYLLRRTRPEVSG
jgi:iron complex transport system permease protein